MNVQKLIERILSGRSDANFDFEDLCRLLTPWDLLSESRVAIIYLQALVWKR